MAKWRIVKRTVSDGINFHIEREDKRGNWVGYGVADTLEEAKEKLSQMKAYLENNKEEVVYQE